MRALERCGAVRWVRLKLANLVWIWVWPIHCSQAPFGIIIVVVVVVVVGVVASESSHFLQLPKRLPDSCRLQSQ
jgi:hypothetical protein